jgi:hypothetical protein
VNTEDEGVAEVKLDKAESWQDVVEAMGWDLDSEYSIAMDFLFEKMKLGEEYEAYILERAKAEEAEE